MLNGCPRRARNCRICGALKFRERLRFSLGQLPYMLGGTYDIWAPSYLNIDAT